MRERAPAKVNLCLFLGEARADGRHELVTLFESISLFDELELTVLDAAAEDEVVCGGVEGPNLVAAALGKLRERGWQGPPVRVEIHKRIPVAAGLGGGSADAAAVLRMARELAPVPDEVLYAVAAELGADVPSQLQPGVCLGTGAGERVEAVGPLDEHAFLIVPAPVALATADVYREADRLELARLSLDGMREQVLAHLPRPQPSLMVNDLEPAAVSLCPEIDVALEVLREVGADLALVCGSGPTVAGLWWDEGARARAAEAAGLLSDQFTPAFVVQPVAS
jgi:4-diphosphocytidyl-2-C-methyl-D-erythritol kinase